jgi:hypothetical protein
MEYQEKWKEKYQVEIEHALAARLKGNEGMARVCARRAAGIIIGEYLTRLGSINLSNSIVDRISFFISLPGIDHQIRDIASHFLIKVKHDHRFPVEVDLLSEAQWLGKSLLL